MNDQLERLKQAQAARRAMLAEWRSNQLHEETLPSGLVVFMRDVTVTDLAMTGKLPPSIMELAEKEQEKGNQELNLKELMENVPEINALLDILPPLVIVEPPVAEIADDDHISINEISKDDKMFLLQWIFRETTAVTPFRNEGKPVPPGSDGQTVLDETQLNPAVADRLDQLSV
jgi:hypothetical protein